MAELADAADLKSAALKRGVGVRVPLSAPKITRDSARRSEGWPFLLQAHFLAVPEECGGRVLTLAPPAPTQSVLAGNRQCSTMRPRGGASYCRSRHKQDATPVGPGPTICRLPVPARRSSHYAMVR